MRPSLLLLLAASALGACGTLVDLPDPGPAIPVIEGLLVAGSPASRFRLVWSEPLDGSGHARPIDPRLVRLELVAPAGREPLTPVADSAGYFGAGLPIDPGRTYRLEGQVDGRSIRAQATIPSRFDVALPADSLVVPRDPGFLVPYRWSAEGATAFLLRGARFRSTLGPASREPDGELFFDPPPAGVAVDSLVVFALTREADEYLFTHSSPRSNVEGGFGYLGGAIAVRRIIRWP